MYGAWLNGQTPAPSPSASGTADEDSKGRKSWSADGDIDLAAEVWEKFTEPAKRLFSTLIDNPGERFDGEQLAEMLDMPKGKHGVAGLLGWPGRHCHAVNRKTVWSSDYADGELMEYWFTPENAALFRQARDSQG